MYQRIVNSPNLTINLDSDSTKSEMIRGKTVLKSITQLIFRLTLIVAGIIFGFAFYHRTTNIWSLKNLGDSFLSKSIGKRPIIIGAFHRPLAENNINGHFAVLQFIGDVRQSHQLYCHSKSNGQVKTYQAHIERIHKGKRGTNDICSWAGHLAECQITGPDVDEITVSAFPDGQHAIKVEIEKPLYFKERQPLVVCVGPMYIYTEWQILITGIETWLAMGATKFIVPIGSASKDTYRILKEYEAKGIVILRNWPMWPVLSDINPNGLVLSRGIEESHVNCLHFVKPFTDLVVFTDIDDMLLPPNPMNVKPGASLEILRSLFLEHPQAGSFLFEHRDTQFVLPETGESTTLKQFNFDFLTKSQWKQGCNVWRMKTRVAVNASRVDSVNMHETGIHRLGYVAVKLPCHKAHFYHLRHSYKNIGSTGWPIDMTNLATMLNTQWNSRLASFGPIATKPLVKSSTESFKDFDQCVEAINSEHWTFKVSRCMTPHVCYSRLAGNMECIATLGDYEFVHDKGDFITVLNNVSLVNSSANCEAPLPKYIKGDYFYLP
uniref:Glycosyltransferase family 92 protein n=1 Tax=Panagrolaimus sp. JU765 TaxID=591449 RepID=A0AC34RBL3_9BILA